MAQAIRLESSWRARPARQTWDAVRPAMERCGIARITEITRLDRLGLPVFVGVRPRGQAVRVHAGKGLRRIDARVGALMESIEYAFAEPPPGALPQATVGDVSAQLGPGLTYADLAPRLGTVVAAHERIPVAWCRRVGARGGAWLPAELVHVPFEPPPGASHFGWTTNGLASGNTLAEATLHGLFEVLEHDAASMRLARDDSAWVPAETLPQPFRARAARWSRQGIALSVRSLPNVLGLACFEAVLHEPGSTTVNLAGGAGLHLDRRVALARAVAEAAQSRAGMIHGGREDVVLYFEKYLRWSPQQLARADAHTVAAAFDRRRVQPYGAVPHRPPAGLALETVLRRLVARLADAGFPAVYRHVFAGRVPGVRVVKVLVPRCEDCDSVNRRLGPRLLARVCGPA